MRLESRGNQQDTTSAYGFVLLILLMLLISAVHPTGSSVGFCAGALLLNGSTPVFFLEVQPNECHRRRLDLDGERISAALEQPALNPGEAVIFVHGKNLVGGSPLPRLVAQKDCKPAFRSLEMAHQ